MSNNDESAFDPELAKDLNELKEAAASAAMSQPLSQIKYFNFSQLLKIENKIYFLQT